MKDKGTLLGQRDVVYVHRVCGEHGQGDVVYVHPCPIFYICHNSVIFINNEKNLEFRKKNLKKA